MCSGAVILASILVMGGCSAKDKEGAPTISAEKAPLGLSGLSNKDFARHFTMPARDVDAAQSAKALAALGLSTSKEDGLSWDTQNGGNGNYVFTNMKVTSDSDVLTISRAEIFGVHMDGEDATFDRADFGDLSISSNDVGIKVAAMSVAKPTPDTAKALIISLKNLADGAAMDFSDGAELGFGALSIKSADITADGSVITMDQLVWGQEDNTDVADFKIENFEMTLQRIGSDVADLIMLKSVSARGYNTAQLKDVFSPTSAKTPSGLLSALSNQNIFAKPYDDFNLEGFEYDSPAVNLNIPKIEGKALSEGQITNITQVMAPFTVKIKDIPSRNQDNSVFENLKTLGFTDMEFAGSQTTILDEANDTVELKDGILDMSDGFRLNFTYGASGLKTLAELKDVEDNGYAEILSTMKINGITLSLEDKSIVERGLELAAQMRGGDVKQIKREMRAALTLAPLLAKNDIEKVVYGQLGSAFMDLVDEGGTFTVQMAPATPIALSAFQDTSALRPEDIGFSARHDK